MKKAKLLLVAMAMLFMYGCGSDKNNEGIEPTTAQSADTVTENTTVQATQATQSAEAVINPMGNSSSNYINSAYAVKYDNLIYFIGKDSGSKGIYRLDNSTGVAELLSSEQGSDLSSIDGSLYYLYEGSIYKMPQGGGQPELFKEDGAIEDICVTSEWIYYVKKDDNGLGKIYKFTHAGTGDKLLTPKSQPDLDVKTITFENSKIYFTDSKGIGSIFLDGSNLSYLFTDYAVTDYAISGDYIYFVYQGKIFRIKSGAGSEAVQCNATNVSRINIVGDTIYLVSDSGIGKMPLAGGTVTQLSPEKPTEISICGDYVFGTKGLYFYRMKTDGSGAVSFGE